MLKGFNPSLYVYKENTTLERIVLAWLKCCNCSVIGGPQLYVRYLTQRPGPKEEFISLVDRRMIMEFTPIDIESLIVADSQLEMLVLGGKYTRVDDPILTASQYTLVQVYKKDFWVYVEMIKIDSNNEETVHYELSAFFDSFQPISTE